MDGLDRNRGDAGFRTRTRVGDARECLRGIVADATDAGPPAERVAPAAADGRVLAEPVESDRAVPAVDRAARDGYAVRAEDTFGASDRAPAVLEAREGAVAPRTAVRVDAGDELPDGADAVAPVRLATEAGGDVELAGQVAVGDGVTSAGADVEAGERLYGAGRRLRPSDLGVLRAVGRDRLPVAARPAVAVVPTGDEFVDESREEANGLVVSRLLERWGADATRRDPVVDDPGAIRDALDRVRSADAVVAIGGTGLGRTDRVPEAIDDRGEVRVHGLAADPGASAAIGTIDGTPTIALPGAPVSALVVALELLRPAVARLQGAEPAAYPTVEARLERKLASEPGIRTFARVRLAAREDGPAAVPTGTGGADRHSSLASADGWVVVPEGTEGIPSGETVAVERRESN